MKKGDFVKVKEKEYRHIEYDGIITEVFKDMIQIYGEGYKTLGYHEFNRKEITVKKIEKDKVKFIFIQAINKMKNKKLSAEIKYKNLENELKENESLVTEFLK